jgi:xanthine dehydrogenase/oxidase
MPRSQNAHAVVNAAFLFKFQNNSHTLEKVSIVYGGIAANFSHANKTEAVLTGKDLFDERTLKLALKTLHEEIKPEEMVPEPSAAYRKMLAITLFYKVFIFC